MEDEERQQLRELLRAHQSRLQVLELQQAQQGIQTPAQVITELADIRREIVRVEAQLGRRIPTVSRAALRQIRQQALAAFYAKEWEQAEELLDQVAQADAGDKDVHAKLVETQRQLDLRAFYQVICDLRQAGNWRAALAALDDLEQQQPGYPDPQRVRAWAEGLKADKFPSGTIRTLPQHHVAPQARPPVGDPVQSVQVRSVPKRGAFIGRAAVAGLIILILAIVIASQVWDRLAGTGATTTPTTAVLTIGETLPALPTITPAQAGAQFRVINTGAEGLFLRPDHSTDGTPLKTLRDGTIVTVIGEDFSGPDTIWKHVRDPDGSEGWTMSQFLQAVQ